ncbi:hypothetical protein EDD18DRAFT_1107757 [Armillaria luteobubalina]|uniref:Uncharacterized protein n=1 Tax=Armillaria luteobubalina TaxID=153913 RepID=A0AA39UM44_9AGAR|nr:hypothetical protein EDD18DRAFT_1107757 [Armillaria luteobubalina]
MAYKLVIHFVGPYYISLAIPPSSYWNMMASIPTKCGDTCAEISTLTRLPKKTLYDLPEETMSDIAHFTCTGTDSASHLIGQDSVLLARQSLRVFMLRRIILSLTISTLLLSIAVMFSEIALEGCVYSAVDYMTIFAHPSFHRLSLGAEDRSVCQSQLVTDLVASQDMPDNSNIVQLNTLVYCMERGTSYLVQSPAIQTYFLSGVCRLNRLFFQGDFDVQMFVQGVIDSNGVTLQYLDVMLYDFDNMLGPINSDGVAFNLSNYPNTAQLAELLKVLFKEEGIEFDSNVYCDVGIDM